MRPSLVPGLVAAAERNARRALTDVALFEVGQIFLGPGDTDQRDGGGRRPARPAPRRASEGRHWRGGGPVDAFDAKADAMALLAALGVANAVQVVPGGPDFLHPGPLGDAAVRAEDRRRLVRRSCIRASARRSTRKGRSWPSRSCSTPSRRRRRGRPRPSPGSTGRTSCRSSATSPSWSTKSVRAGDLLKAAPERRARARLRHRRVRRLPGQGPAGRNEVDRDHGHSAAARTDPDRRRDRGGGRPDRGGGVQADRRDASGAERRCARRLLLASLRPSCRAWRAPQDDPACARVRGAARLQRLPREPRAEGERRRVARRRRALAKSSRTPPPRAPRRREAPAPRARPRRPSVGATAASTWSSGSAEPAYERDAQARGMAGRRAPSPRGGRSARGRRAARSPFERRHAAVPSTAEPFPSTVNAS